METYRNCSENISWKAKPNSKLMNIYVVSKMGAMRRLTHTLRQSQDSDGIVETKRAHAETDFVNQRTSPSLEGTSSKYAADPATVENPRVIDR